MIGLLNITGLALSLGLSLVKIGEGSMILLLIAVALVCFILGLGLPTTGVYLLVAMLAAPPLVKLGVPPMAAHMFVLFHRLPLDDHSADRARRVRGRAHRRRGPMRVGWIACRSGGRVSCCRSSSPGRRRCSDRHAREHRDVDRDRLRRDVAVCSAIAGTLPRAIGRGSACLAGVAATLLLVPAGGTALSMYLHAAGLALGVALVVRARRSRAQPQHI